MSGTDLLLHIGEKEYQYPVLVLSSLNSDEAVFKALESGAVGYVYKDELSDIGGTIRILLEGGAIISPTIALRVLHRFRKKKRKDLPEELTPREIEVLELLVEGYSTTAAAEKLFISVHTLRVHVKNMYRKLSVGNKVELMRRAREFGIY